MSLFVITYVLLLQAIVFRFLGYMLGRNSIVYIFVFNFLILALIILYNFFFSLYADIPIIYEIDLGIWFKVGLLNISWLFIYDSVSLLMGLMILIISFLVHIYSVSYLSNDPFLIRFLSYLSLFTFFMFLLITANNFIIFFFGWEGVGLSSYLLISFWNTRVQAGKAALKALIVNRVGDFFLLISICFCFKYFGSLDFDLIISIAPYFTTLIYKNIFGINIFVIDLITLCLFIGVIGKSAQFGLHIWLPDAMEGPTPVSALIHAATMVTAGVFLLIRLSYLFILSKNVLLVITIVGSITAITTALIGLVQYDIKKIIAYSTCSQLGYMVFIAGSSNFVLSFYHLLNHAFFKALLFLAAGSIIHAVAGEQDLRKLGGLIFLPLQTISFFIGTLAITGFFFFSGFYSKDILLSNMNILSSNTIALFSYWVSLTTTLLTCLYSFKLLYIIFQKKFRGNLAITKIIFSSSNKIEMYIAYPLIVLSILSIFSGYLLQDYFIKNSLFFNYTIVADYNLIEAEYIPIDFKIIPAIFSYFSLLCIVLWYHWINKHLYKIKIMFILAGNKFFIDSLYVYVSNLFLNSALTLYFFLDKGILELWGPYGIYYLLKKLSINITILHSFNLFLNLFLLLSILILLLFSYFLIN